MPTTLADLVGEPSLELQCAYPAAGLDRPVRWAHSTELLDPSRTILQEVHGLVPTVLVSISDAIAGIIVAFLAALWALFFLIGSIPSIVKSLKLKA